MQSSDQNRQSALREAHLRDYWKIVWQGRWTIVAVFIAVVGLTAGWTFLQTPIYRSTAIVEIQPQAQRIMASGDVSGLGASGFGWFAEEKYHNTQIEIIKSRDVAQRVVRNLHLEKHPFFESHPDPVELFRKMVLVDPRRDTGLLEISMVGANRDDITQWVNAVAHAYEQRNFDRARANGERAIEAIKRQLNQFTEELSTAEETRIDALEDTQIYDAETQEEIIRQKIQTYTTELTTADLEQSRLAETIRKIRSMQQQGTSLLAVSSLSSDEVLQELHRQRVELDRKLESSKVDLRSGHPEVEKLIGEIEAVEQRIGQQIGVIVGGLTHEYDEALSHARYLQSQIRLAEDLSLQVAKATSRYDIIKTDAETKKQIFDVIAKTVNEVQLSMELMSNNVAVLDEAVPPLFAIKPRKKVNLAIGAMFGVFLGFASVFFLDYLDNTIRTPEDIEKYLGVAVLGVVPKMSSQGLNQRAVKEAYQSLRTSIIFSSKNRSRKLVLITSTGPREGKSSTISNLGRTLAAAGDRVIVIDCDLRRPKQHVHFSVEREPGVTNYLAAPADETDWTPFMRQVGPGELYLMSSGPIPPNPPELLGNTRFTDMLAAMRETFDWVLIDSPPAATLADASLLASTAEMIVAVVQHNQTDRDHVVKTIQQLRAVNGEIAGVVLNNVDLDRAYHKDYYYAGYYYSEDEKTPRVRRRREQRPAKVG